MVELIEYAIVFGISAGLAGACVLLVDGAMPGLNQVATTSKADQVAGAARLAVVQGGNVTLVLPLDNSTISCESGSLSVSSTAGTSAYDVGYPCAFDYQGLSGSCTLVFAAEESLEMEASC